MTTTSSPPRRPRVLVAADGATDLARIALALPDGGVLAHQDTSQLVRRGDAQVLDAVLGDVGTTIAFRVGPRDAELLEPVFAPRASAADVASQPDYRAVVRSAGELGNVPFTLRTRAAPDGLVGLAGAIRALSRLKHDRDREIVDAEIAATMADFRGLGQPARPPPVPA